MNEIEEVQKLCKDNMKRFGYNLINDQKDLEDENFNIMNPKFDHMDEAK